MQHLHSLKMLVSSEKSFETYAWKARCKSQAVLMTRMPAPAQEEGGCVGQKAASTHAKLDTREARVDSAAPQHCTVCIKRSQQNGYSAQKAQESTPAFSAFQG